MLYSIYQIQSKLAQFPEYREQKSDIMQFFTMNNIFENLKVKTAYTSENFPPLFLEEKDIKKICQIASHIFGVEFNYEKFYEGKNALPKILENDNSVKKYTINNVQDLNSVIDEHYNTSSYGLKEQEKEKQKEIRKEKEAVLLAQRIAEKKAKEWAEFDKATNLKRDFENSKIVSIDFEFFLKKHNSEQKHIVTEMGITTLQNDVLVSQHYLVEETYLQKKNRNLQNKFDFGETKIVKLEEMKNILQNSLKDTQYVLFHEQREDFEILQTLGVVLDPQVNVMDTQLCYKRYFRERGSLPNGEPLENLLNSFNVKYKDLHNAGNDSYYTLILLKEMQKTLLHNNNKASLGNNKKHKM